MIYKYQKIHLCRGIKDPQNYPRANHVMESFKDVKFKMSKNVTLDYSNMKYKLFIQYVLEILFIW